MIDNFKEILTTKYVAFEGRAKRREFETVSKFV